MAEALVLTFAYSGLRKTEARTLEWGSVNLIEGWLRFRGKRSKERMVPLHPAALDALIRWRGASNEPRWVFPSTVHPDRPVSDTYIRHLVWDVGNAAGLHRLHAHVFRHTAATTLLEATGNLRTVPEFLGHADPKTTAIYARVRPAALREAVGLMSFEASS